MRGISVTQGSISKLVTSYGTRWGRIQPVGESREIFFNSAALDKAIDFLSLVVGQVVEFQERKDQVNGSHAEHVLLVPRLSGTPA
jgi:cold shock CspA family protein